MKKSLKINLLKIKFIYIYFILLLNPLHSGTNTITFSKIYSDKGNDKFFSARQVSDNGYIAVGSSESKAKEKSDIWIIKTDDRGKLQWEKTYGKDEWDRANDVFETSDHGYIILGETINEEIEGRQVKLIKLDSKGKLSWIKTYQYSDDTSGNSILETRDGNFLIVGSLFFRELKKAYLWVLKVNKKGKAIWSTNYGGAMWDTGLSVCETPDGDYVIAGIIEDKISNLKNGWILKISKRGHKIWEKVFERYYWDAANAIICSSNNNLMVAGYTYDKILRKSSAWVLRLDEKGNRLWDKIYGGKDWDNAQSITQLPDGNYMIAGFTKSKGPGGKNVYIVKINKSGKIIWEKTYGDHNDDAAYSISATSDNGAVIAGYTFSVEEEVSDAWLLKIDKSGNVQKARGKTPASVTCSVIWHKKYNYPGRETPVCLVNTPDNNYLIGGYSIASLNSDKDGLLLKINSKGAIDWKKIYHLPNDDQINDIKPVGNNEFIAAGYTFSKGEGKSDAWIIKVNDSGKMIWNTALGGMEEDKAFSICRSKNGGYCFSGYTKSKGEGKKDFWVTKLDDEGRIVWDQTFGGKDDDEAYSIIHTDDRGYLVAGQTRSTMDGSSDILIIKLNSFGKLLWKNTYGTTNDDMFNSLQVTKRNGLIITGTTKYKSGFSDFFVTRTSAKGKVIWKKNYSQSIYDMNPSACQSKDGNFLIAGTTFSPGSGGFNLWLIKLDGNGYIIWNKTIGEQLKEIAGPVTCSKANSFLLAGTTYNSQNQSDIFLLNFEEKEKNNAFLITTEPDKAEIYLDSKFQGLSPVEIERKEKPFYKLSIKKDNYYTIEDKIFFHNSKNDRFFYKLKKKTGTIIIISYNPGIKVIIDGKPGQKLELNKALYLDLQPGKHELKFINAESVEKLIPVSTVFNGTNYIILDEDFFRNKITD